MNRVLNSMFTLLSVLCALGVSSVQGQPIYWTQLQPSARYGTALVYDASRGIGVMFGGQRVNSTGNSVLDAETWQWDGAVWAQRLVSGPSPRSQHAMSHDTVRGVSVLFGGMTNTASGTRSGETWEWNGISWSQRTVAGPAPRTAHSMVFDQVRGVTVLFGGSVGESSASGETWEWDGTSWSLRSITGPSPRINHAMAYDSGRGVAVLFGGYSSINPGNTETWEWDGNVWSLRTTIGPSARQFPAMSYDSHRGRTVLFGGDVNGTLNAETWEWDGAIWTRRTAIGPVGRSGHVMAYDSARGLTLLFGGRTLTSSGVVSNAELWTWDGTSWIYKEVLHPTLRRNSQMTFDSQYSRILLFGGTNVTGSLADTWLWDGTRWRQWIGNGPTARSSHAMTYEPSRSTTLLFGGLRFDAAGNAILNAETWEWSNANEGAWTQQVAVGPSPRYGHALAFDELRQVAVLFGGYTGTTYSDETWEWNGATWIQRLTSGPSGRNAHAMAYDKTRRVVVLFGGYSNGIVNGDTWELDVNGWIHRVVGGPSARQQHSLVYNDSRGVCVLFGGGTRPGATYVTNSQSWEWNGTTWTQLLISGPSSRAAHAMTYDETREVTVLFGGSNSNGQLSDETWKLGPPCTPLSIASQPESQVGCMGSPARFNVTISFADETRYSWRKDAVPIDPSLNGSASTSSLLLSTVRRNDEGVYDCIVTNPCGSLTSATAILTVCPGDFNCDDIIDFFDYLDFVGEFSSSSSSADFNGDSLIDFFDYLDFVQAFSDGC